MNNDTLMLILSFLTLSVTLNLWLTFKLINTVKYLKLDNPTNPALPIGSVSPDFNAMGLDNRTVLSTDLDGYAKVWIFLSSACDKCKAKLPEIERLMVFTGGAGVQLKILSDESKRQMNGFLNTQVLQHNTLLLDKKSYSILNPQGASPFYWFVDNDNVLQANGFIGDENWLGFVEQLSQEELSQ